MLTTHIVSHSLNTMKRFLLVHGSQTGQAQAIAEEIRDRAIKRGLQPELYCLSQSEKKFHLEKEPVIVVVVSTTGDGEPPDTVSKFWRKLKRRTVPKDHLSLCSYALLGLGDSNYTNFCNMGKMLNRRLLEVGAKQFYAPGFADDGVGSLELVVEPWIDGLWQPLETLLNSHAKSVDPSLPEVSSECSAIPTGLRHVAKAEREKLVPENVIIIAGEEDGDKEEIRSRTDMGNTEVVSVPNSDLGSKQGDGDSVERQPLVASQHERLTGKDEEDLSLKLQQDLTLSNDSDSSNLHDGKALQTLSTDLAGLTLTLPSVQPPYIEVHVKNDPAHGDKFPYDEVTYGIKTSVSFTNIVRRHSLTQEGSLKKTIELEISLQDAPELNYMPGDAFGFVCPNNSDEVQWLMERLQLSPDPNQLMSMSIIPGTTKRNPMLSKHIPNPCSVVNYFTYCADIRCVPKKALLGFLSTCCSHPAETRRLQELSSRQGAKEYTRNITEQHTDFLDVLYFFPSCLPPIERLIELLPRLQPRYYSAASSPLAEDRKLRIAFNVERLPSRRWQDRRLGTDRLGLATGWFDRVTSPLPVSGVKVPIFPRVHNPFHLPDDLLQPIVMIGPGTGVSPFIAFLQHREKLRGSNDTQLGKSWLFFGCRHPDKDFIFKDTLEGFTKSGVLTHCHVCFSRFTPPSTDRGDQPCYVQDNVRMHWMELAQWIVEDNAAVYVCGDAKNMAKDVHVALLDVITKYSDLQPDLELVPGKVLTELKENGRYLVDAWS